MGVTSDIRALLVAGGVTPVYTGNMPDQPDNCVVVFHDGGGTRSLSGSMVEEPMFQVRIRNTVYATGEALCDTIKDLLHGVNNVTAASGDKILLIAQEGDVNDIGRDDSKRQEWTINFRTYWIRT